MSWSPLRRPIRLESRIRPEVAVTNMAGETTRETAYRREARRSRFRPDDPNRLVVGRVSADEVTVTAQRAGFPHTWAPQVRGQVSAYGSGSVFEGTIGWSREAMVAQAYVTLGLLGTSVAFLVGGAEEVVPLLLGFAVFLIGLTAFGLRMQREDEAWLERWLSRHLDAR